MSAPTPIRRPTAPRQANKETEVEAIQKQNRVLLHALQICQPVIYRGQQRFVHTINFQISGGGVSTTIYLNGIKDPVDPNELTIDSNHHTLPIAQ